MLSIGRGDATRIVLVSRDYIVAPGQVGPVVNLQHSLLQYLKSSS